MLTIAEQRYTGWGLRALTSCTIAILTAWIQPVGCLIPGMGAEAQWTLGAERLLGLI